MTILLSNTHGPIVAYHVEVTNSKRFDCRMGIKESMEWLVEVMERSKRTETLRVRAGVAGPGA